MKWKSCSQTDEKSHIGWRSKAEYYTWTLYAILILILSEKYFGIFPLATHFLRFLTFGFSLQKPPCKVSQFDDSAILKKDGRKEMLIKENDREGSENAPGVLFL